MQALTEAWRRRGPTAWLLRPLAWLYGAVLAWRRAAYRSGRKRAVRVARPVVIVGNLIVGGAGKTPTVLAVVAALRGAGWQPGIVSRGYGRRDDAVREVTAASTAAEVGDEPLLLARRAGVPVIVGRDRPAAAAALIARHPAVDVIVADDGLQHLALARDVEVVVFDERGAGNGWLLPAGPLRELLPPGPAPAAAPEAGSSSSAQRGHELQPARIVLYNAPGPTTAMPGFVGRRRLTGAVALADWWAGQPADRASLTALAGRRVLAAAGMAQPDRFFAMLRAEGLEVEPLPLPDHHDFARLPWPPGTATVLVTEKDAVKLSPASVGETAVWVVTLDFEPEPAFADRLLACLGHARHRAGASAATGSGR